MSDTDLGILGVLHTNGETYFLEDVPRDKGEYLVRSYSDDLSGHEYAWTPEETFQVLFTFHADEVVAIEWVEYGHEATGFLK